MKNIVKIAGIAILGAATVMGYLRYQAFKSITTANNDDRVIDISEHSADNDSRK